MEIHVHSTLALRKQKEKNGKVTIAQGTPGYPALRTGWRVQVVTSCKGCRLCNFKELMVVGWVGKWNKEFNQK